MNTAKRYVDALVASLKKLGHGADEVATALWDASQIKQPGWNHVQQAFIDGAREARANPDAKDADFCLASDGYTKRVFEELDPASEEALRTESWRRIEFTRKDGGKTVAAALAAHQKGQH